MRSDRRSIRGFYLAANFVHLHVHSSYSALESTVRINDLIKKCQEYEMPAVAITDHMNMCGAIDFYQKAKKAGIKPIFGCEVYIENEAAEKESRVPEARLSTNRLVLLAQNMDGFKALKRLISRGYLEGRQQRAVLQKEWIEEEAEGLIALSGGLKSLVSWNILRGNTEAAAEEFAWLVKTFGRRFYAELLQNGLREQRMINQFLVGQCEKHGVKYVAASDVHYLEKDDAEAHEILTCIKLGRTVNELDGKQACKEFWFKDPETMETQFEEYPEALANTLEIAEQCNVEFKFTDDEGKPIYYLPDFEIPEGEKAKDIQEYLYVAAKRGLEERFKEIRFERVSSRPDFEEHKKVYYDRLDYEVKLINQMGFPGYFLIVADFIQWAKDQDIPVGPGRGSGAGSLVAWALKITDLDPIFYKLLFERFINPERISMPDFDIDFCQDRRGEVIDYVKQKYGKDKVSQIITFGKLQTKQCIRDVGRVLNMPYGEVDQIAKLVPDVLGITLTEALEKEPELTNLRNTNPTIDKLFKNALKLEGLIRNFGKHAGGVIITDKPLTEYSPLYTDEDGAVIVQYDKDASETVGLVKFDFLGLKTLTHIQNASKMISQSPRYKEKHDKEFRIEEVGEADEKAFELIRQGDTLGVFQVESSGMIELCKKIRPDSIDELTAINALYRPGPLESGMVDDYINRKHGRVKIEHLHPKLESTLAETFGVIVYQEQVMQSARVLAGYSLGEADILRRAMGKKKPEEMAKQKIRFAEGAEKDGIDKDKAIEIFDLIEKFSGYGFNKSHAAAYAYVSFQTAYLKAHYPAQFYAALLTMEMSDTDKLAKYISDAKAHNIPVLGPDVNMSSRFFNVVEVDDEEQIRFGLEAIKNVGSSAVEVIVKERDENGPFRSFSDFCKRVSLRKVNKKTIEALIRTGAFDEMAGERGLNRKSLLGAMEKVMSWAAKEQEQAALGQGGLFDMVFDESDGPQLNPGEPEIRMEKEFSHLERLGAERDLLGFYVSGHPLDPHLEVIRYACNCQIATIHQLAADGKIAPPPTGRDRRNQKEYSVGGLVTAAREILTKKGQKMAFLTLEDLTGKIEVVVFPRTYENVHPYCKTGEIVVITAAVEVAEKAGKLMANKIQPVSDFANDKLKSVSTIVLRLEKEMVTEEKLRELGSMCQEFQGTCRGIIEYDLGEGLYAKMALPEDNCLSSDPRFIDRVKEMFGNHVVELR